LGHDQPGGSALTELFGPAGAGGHFSLDIRREMPYILPKRSPLLERVDTLGGVGISGTPIWGAAPLAVPEGARRAGSFSGYGSSESIAQAGERCLWRNRLSALPLQVRRLVCRFNWLFPNPPNLFIGTPSRSAISMKGRSPTLFLTTISRPSCRFIVRGANGPTASRCSNCRCFPPTFSPVSGKSSGSRS